MAALAMSCQLQAATVSGVVTDTNGKPVEGAIVTVKGNNVRVVTDENGRYLLEDLVDGHVHIHVTSSKHIHGDKEFDDFSGTKTADFVLKASSIENIVVTANSLQSSVLESVTPVSVLAGDELRKRQAPTLGETLKTTPGINSSYFGPVASSPIIRGNDGPRVKITQNSLDVSDASRVGVDHNVGVDAGTATQIEVLRGPATLQYGSGAIGGVVNVVDNRIPRTLTDGIEGEAEFRHETASDEKFSKVDLNASAGKVAFHLDAFNRETNDVEIPGFAEREPDEGEEPGTLESSNINATSVTGGLSYIGDRGYIGFSVQQLDNLYGIPGHHEEEEGEEEEGEEEEGVSLDVDSTRYQLAGELLRPFEGINNIKLAVGYTDYEHVELEGDEIGTLFANETTELRLSAEHESIGGWHGTFGVNASDVNFLALGDEAFTPPSDTETIALYLVEEKRVGNMTWQFGGRLERNELSADPFEVPLVGFDEPVTLNLPDLDFTSVSLSGGFNWEYKEGYSFAVSLSRSERAPTQQELFSAGEHVATQTFDLGAFFTTDADGGIILSGAEIEEEVATNIDLTLRKFSGNWGYTFTVFYNQVDDYLFQADTGFFFEDDEDLPIQNFRQEDADLFGFEAEFKYQINDIFNFSAFSDFTRADVDSGDLPRIPPLRIGGELAFVYQGWNGDVGVIWHDDQDRIAEFETETDGYTLLEAGVNYTWATQNTDWIFFARGTNLTDEEARLHTSFLVDLAPLPGRGFTLGVRTKF